MKVLSRHVDAVVVELHWKRTLVVEQGRWEHRRTSWKPHGDHVRNLRTIHDTQPDIVLEGGMRRAGASMPASRTHEVMSNHTYFEYEEFGWHPYRSFSADGDSPADVRWPECDLQPEQRITQRRETYRAKFSVSGIEGDIGYMTELDEATWRSLKVGRRYRLKVGAFSDEVKQVSPARH